jgi:division protein CdvB (Snf7/Vps24/ESCRT-III family)
MEQDKLIRLIEEMQYVMNKAAMSIPVKMENAEVLGEIFSILNEANTILREWRKESE